MYFNLAECLYSLEMLRRGPFLYISVVVSVELRVKKFCCMKAHWFTMSALRSDTAFHGLS